MKRLVAISAIWLCLVGISSAADQQLMGLMMPGAKVLGGVNVTQFLNSPLAQYLLALAPANDANFQKVMQATGFDPRRDISQIVAASPGVPGQNAGLVAIRGTFDVPHILEFVKSTGGKVDESLGVPMIASPDDKASFALLDSSLAVFGDPTNVAAAIGRRSNPSLLDPALVEKAGSLSGSQDVWLISTVTIPSAPTDVPGGMNLAALQNIQQASFGFKFGTSVTVTAEAIADTPQNADALADIVRAGIALISMNDANPQMTQVASVLKGLAISKQGTTLKLTLSVPEDLIEQLSPAGKRPVKRAELK